MGKTASGPACLPFRRRWWCILPAWFRILAGPHDGTPVKYRYMLVKKTILEEETRADEIPAPPPPAIPDGQQAHCQAPEDSGLKGLQHRWQIARPLPARVPRDFRSELPAL